MKILNFKDKDLYLYPTKVCSHCILTALNSYKKPILLKTELVVIPSPEPQEVETKDAKFECYHCGNQYKSKKAIEYHINGVHLGYGHKFKCPKCSKVLTKMGLRYHMIREHGKKLQLDKKREFQCNVCLKKMTKIGLKAHLKTYANFRKPLACKNCLKLFHKPNQLDRHLNLKLCETEEEEKPKYSCKVCLKKLNTWPGYMSHMKIYENYQKPLPCTECSRKFHQKRQLERHMELEHSDGKIQCTQCKVCLKKMTQSSYYVHKEYYKDFPKPLPCTKCSKIFHKPKQLKNHLLFESCNSKSIKLSSNGRSRRFQCKICLKMLTLPGFYSHNQRYGGNSEVFSCKNCDKKFHKKVSLDRHTQQRLCAVFQIEPEEIESDEGMLENGAEIDKDECPSSDDDSKMLESDIKLEPYEIFQPKPKKPHEYLNLAQVKIKDELVLPDCENCKIWQRKVEQLQKKVARLEAQISGVIMLDDSDDSEE